MDTTDTARERVFKTEELLEGILSFLPFKTLFYIRRVSKRWAEGIDGSIVLQQKMFLRPRDQPELWRLDDQHLIDTGVGFRRVRIPTCQDSA